MHESLKGQQKSNNSEVIIHHNLLFLSHESYNKIFAKNKLHIEYFRPHHAWPHDDQCKNFTIDVNTKEPSRLVALASFPASGSTWLRHLIESITGIFTGSFMRHRWSSNDESKYTKTINPFKESFIFM